MKSYIIDGQLMESKDSFYHHLSEVFSLPDYFGNNLDALWDLLNEEEDSTKIIFLNTDQARKGLGTYAESFIQLLEELSLENELYRTYFYE